VVTTLAGSAKGYIDNVGAAALFNTPIGIAVDVTGNVYVADTGNHRIRKVTPGGDVTTVALSVSGFLDGTGTNTRFNTPRGMCLDKAGNLLIADTNNHQIRKLTPAGELSTLVGSSDGYIDDAGRKARFSFPTAVAVDGSGNMYIADLRNFRIRKVQP